MATTIIPNSIESEESFGVPLVGDASKPIESPLVYRDGNPVTYKTGSVYYYTQYQTITPNSIDESEVGSPTITTGPISVYPSSVESSASFGSPKVNLVLHPVSIESAASFGVPHLSIGPEVIRPPSIASAESFGTATIKMMLYPISIESIAEVSTPKVNLQLHPASIAGAEAFGIPTVHTITVLRPSPIPDSFQVGSPSLKFILYPQSIPSREKVGIPNVVRFIIMTQSVESEEAFGTPTVTQTFIWHQIKTFDPVLWQSLYDKEQYCYNLNDGHLTTYQSKFKALANGILAYFNDSWTDTLRDFIMSLYSYIVFDQYYNTGSDQLTFAASSDVFSMNSYIPTIKSQTVSYYADYNGSTTPHLDSDTTLITSTAYNVDKSNLVTLTSTFRTTVASKTHDLLFDNFPVQSTLDKHQMGVKIFTDLDYARIYRALSVNLTIPSYIQ